MILRIATIALFLPLLCATSLYSQSPDFQIPIEGEAGVDFFIVNYVDRLAEPDAIMDYQCGSKTYDGHQGTDFTLASFARMDSGVGITAAADGTVFFVLDTLFDRNKESVIERGFGNWIGIAHDNGYRTYYAHLKTGSALVMPGDTVLAGQRIALVGSSGNSSDPHLHFEVWKIDTTLRDPFGGGDCGTNPSLWEAQPNYDTDYKLIDFGLLGSVPTLDSLRERPVSRSLFSPPDSAVAFWAHQQGLRQNDVTRIAWHRVVDDALWFEYEFPAELQDWWYHYFWSWIDLPTNDEYIVRYYVNDKLIVEKKFTVQGVTGIKDTDGEAQANGITARYLPGGTNILVIAATNSEPAKSIRAELYNAAGTRVAVPVESGDLQSRQIIDLEKFNLPPGRYFLRIQHGNHPATIPVHISPSR